MTGATVAPPSSVTPTGVAFSLATRLIALAEATVVPSPGVEETTRGAVLSTLIAATTSEEVLPRLSETVARRSYTPSCSCSVSIVALHGELESVPSDDQEAPPAGVIANTTCVAPEPLTVALSVTTPEIVAPGLVRTTVGALTSTVIV